ncbi:hypothetical protein EVAR_95402_1 [Eumeta japonica]|uniref:Uncharacterized protein n=1 Tax=Eumeta variegata TaxID=151549 RepID=A0A4C1VJC8_EUMVA|nr:hypothetical protein EVAR_95402_1 [Eumeta japonica]
MPTAPTLFHRIPRVVLPRYYSLARATSVRPALPSVILFFYRLTRALSLCDIADVHYVRIERTTRQYSRVKCIGHTLPDRLLRHRVVIAARHVPAARPAEARPPARRRRPSGTPRKDT